MEELKKIFMSIPSDKNKLFSVPIDWALFATVHIYLYGSIYYQSNLLERKVRPWLVNKCIEYLGEEEKVFIDAIIKRLINKETPQNIINKVISKVLVDEPEVYI